MLAVPSEQSCPAKNLKAGRLDSWPRRVSRCQFILIFNELGGGGGPRCGRQLRDDPVLDDQVRARDRPAVEEAAVAPDAPLASLRDGLLDRRKADVSVARLWSSWI